MFALSRAAQRRLRHARHPGSVFAPQQSGLADAVARAHEREVRLRDLLFEAVERTLPPQAAERVSALGSLFDLLDEYLHHSATMYRVALPVLDVPEELRPAVTRLRIRVPGGNEAEARPWGLRLKSALMAQPYTATMGT